MKSLLAVLLMIVSPARAEWGQFDFDFDQDKPWSEIAVQLPAYPKADNLIPFYVSPTTPHRYFVDARSVSVGEDQVVRYTVVVEAQAGARNVSFEGLRCETAERRLYAYGHADGSWSKARNAGWEGIRFRSPYAYQRALFEDHFCPGRIRVRDGAEAVGNLRRAAR